MSLELHYFAIQARVEAAYLIALQGNVPVVRKNVENFAQSELKEQAPFGQVPVLIIDGTTILSQSLAICQYLARRGGLIPTDPLAEAMAFQYVLGADEFRSEAYRLHRVDTDETKEASKKQWKEGRMAFFLSKFESFLEKNNTNKSGDLFLVGSSLTWADICFYDALFEQSFLLTAEELTEKYPLLAKHKQQIENLSNLKDYIVSPNRPPAYLPKWRN